MGDHLSAMVKIRVAFLILAHDDACHLKRLCEALQPHTIFVHLDAKSSDMLAGKIDKIPNVIVLRPSIPVHWADFSMVEATLALLRLARDHGSFERYVLLSGSCYPIKSMSSLDQLFAREPCREWINLTPIKAGSHLSRLIDRRWHMAPILRHKFSDEKLRAVWNKVSQVFKRNLGREIQMAPYHGSQWWALTDGCIEMIMEFVAANYPFVKAYERVFAPDEQFFHTIVGNSHFAASAMQVDDNGQITNQLIPLHLIGMTEDRYWNFTEDMFSAIKVTPKFFIRKVSSSRSTELLDRVDAELL